MDSMKMASWARMLVLVEWIGILVCLQSARTQSQEPEVKEYCEWESFNATCGPDEVIMIHGARYGRMNVGRCITENYGNIGCGTDVTSDFDLQCSGKQNCVISVISLHNKRSCPRDFKSYLEAGYKCVKVYHPNVTACPEGGLLRLTGSSGSISSILATETGLGTASCPLAIEVHQHQTIQLSLVDLSMAVGSNHWYYGVQGSSAPCEPYASLYEPGDTLKNRTICGGRSRESVVYTSKDKYLELKISRLAGSKHRFLIKYEALGCPPLPTGPDSWSQNNGDHFVVHCNDTDEAWFLTCKGTTWVGRVGNCSLPMAVEPVKKWGLSSMLGGVTDFPVGILIVVTLGVAIGVAIGVMMLVAVLAYMKRRRRRKVRSRSNYVLKQVHDSIIPEDCKGNTDVGHSDQTPMLIQRRERIPSTPGTLTRQYLDTWQKTRPLPIPRPTSDSGIDQSEHEGLTMTPDSPSPSIFTTFRPDFERTMIVNNHLSATCQREGVPPYYFKVDPATLLPGDYGVAGRPDVLSTCNLCRNNNINPRTNNTNV